MNNTHTIANQQWFPWHQVMPRITKQAIQYFKGLPLGMEETALGYFVPESEQPGFLTVHRQCLEGKRRVG